MRRMVKLCGNEKIRCDGCQFGMRSLKSGLPVQKPWGWFSSCPEIREALNRRCSHLPGQHAKMDSQEIAASATYPTALCRTFARTLMKRMSQELIDKAKVYMNESESQTVHVENRETEDPQQDEAEVNPEEEPEKQTAPMETQTSTPTRQDDHIMKKLRTIHTNLGHPSNHVLHRTLKEAGASPEVLQKALAFECIHCTRRGHAAPHRTSQIPQAQAKWDIVSVDTFWWHSPHKDSKGNPREHVVGISLMDEASDYHVATIVRSGTNKQGSIRSEEFRSAFAKDWLRLLPKPECLRFDDEGSFRDRRLIEWLEAQAIRISVIAGEAAWQVGKHSRHLEVLKENMSLLSSELGPDIASEELLSLSLAAKNEMHSIRGYSPTNGFLANIRIGSSRICSMAIIYQQAVFATATRHSKKRFFDRALLDKPF